MKCLSLTQPWASALFIPGLKEYETRSWSTSYRGPLLIHAAKGFPKAAREFTRSQLGLSKVNQLPLGAIIGRVHLASIQRTADVSRFVSGLERLWGDYTLGRYAWHLTLPELFAEPIPYRGALGLFEVPEGIIYGSTA